jgi:hypothetical protein
MMSDINVDVGDLVAFNMLEDAVWFEVLGIDGFNMTIREHDGHGTPYREQVMDISLVKRVEQREIG